MAKIVGNPTVTPVMPSDWAQKDETKVDYIKNKPTKLSQFENDVEFVDNDTYVTDMEYIDGWLSQNDDNIGEHKIDYNNPHNVTAEQIGAITREELPYAEVAWADEAYDCYWACNADCDSDGNPIVYTYATKKEVGDIESVLDSILAIQETIVGGVN